jgi:hypothetical protein
MLGKHCIKAISLVLIFANLVSGGKGIFISILCGGGWGGEYSVPHEC